MTDLPPTDVPMSGPVREPDVPYVVLDVFTDTPLAGNPLAVFTEGEQIPSRLMQRAARELNLSETVFLLPGDGETCDAQLRIFTPSVELPFAGHPTLGAAFVVGGRTGREHVRLLTGAGVVPVALTWEGDAITFGEMEQPIPSFEPYAEAEAALAALGVRAAALPVDRYVNGPAHVVVALEHEDALTNLAPDLGALSALGPVGVAVVALAPDGTVRSRNFCPGLGVPEDPATGSAAGPVAVHLARCGWTAFGQPITISQGVEIGRPSRLIARADGDGDAVTRVTVGGTAVLVARGAFRLA